LVEQRVQEIVKMLFNQSTIDRSLVDLGVDVRKMSLITPKSIQDVRFPFIAFIADYDLHSHDCYLLSMLSSS